MNAFLWILICGFIFSFFTSWGIGANDAANSFATSVGAKVLTLRQAVLIAAVCEFAGAVLLGKNVTDTIRKKIVSPKAFDDEPYVLMFGMLCASISTSIWLFFASWMKWPVSTTHSTIGAIIGFALVYNTDSIDSDKIVQVVISWIISPLLAGGITVVLLGTNILIVLNKSNPSWWARRFMPVMIGFTIWMITMFIIYKGAPQLDLDELKLTDALWISFVVGLCVGVLSYLSFEFAIFTRLERFIRFNCLKDNSEKTNNNVDTTEDNAVTNDNVDTTEDNAVVTEHNEDVVEINVKPVEPVIDLEDDIDVEANSKYSSSKFTEMKLYDDNVEDLYSYLQVFTAMVSSLAHGSNDVANSIAPLAAMYAIYNDGHLEKKSDVPIWILVLGGAGIVLGLSTWGYRIIDRMGKELSGVTPTRGVSIELGAAIAVLIASRLEFPVSTTHCQVGSIVGSGLVDSFRKNGCSGLLSNKLPNVDIHVFGKIVFAWVVTLPVTIALSATLFAFARESP